MTEIIELDCRVFEAVACPDTPGRCRRTLTIRQLSGPDLDDAQWLAVQGEVVRELIRRGNRVYGVRHGEEDNP